MIWKEFPAGITNGVQKEKFFLALLVLLAFQVMVPSFLFNAYKQGLSAPSALNSNSSPKAISEEPLPCTGL